MPIYARRDFDTDDEEREALSRWLASHTPYPYSYFVRLQNNQLWAQYMRRVRPRRPSRRQLEEQEELEECLNERIPMSWDPDYRPLCKTVDGTEMILTDGGTYIEIED